MSDDRRRERGAADRLLDVLDALAETAPRASLAAIAERARIPKPSAHALLKVLVAHGYARSEPNGVYGPGRHFLSVAGRVLDTTDYAAQARPSLRALQDHVPETVHLAMMSGLELYYVDKLESTGAFRVASRVGTTLPFHCTAIGKAVLAQLSPEERDRILLASGMPRRTPHTITDRAELDQNLAEVKRCGYALDQEENEPDVACVGAPVFGARETVVGGISVSAPAFRLRPPALNDVVPRVVDAAMEVSLALGCSRTFLDARGTLNRGEIEVVDAAMRATGNEGEEEERLVVTVDRHL